MRPENERSRLAGNEAATKQVDQDRTDRVADWAETFEDAERWVEWTARRRWPDFVANDQIWAGSVTSWELYGRAA